MNITIKNVRLVKQFSQETNCFTAKLCVDEKPVCTIQNDGNGGPDYYPVIQNKALFEKVEAFIKKQEYRCPYSKKKRKHSMETFVGDLLQDHILLSCMRSKMSKNWLITLKNTNGVYQYTKKLPLINLKKGCKNLDVVLNEISEPEAFQIFKKK